MRLLIILLALGLNAVLLRAQDNHYWTQQFGGRSTLMGGAVIGGVRDNSALFYNPGAIAFIKHPSLDVSADLYQFHKVDIKNGAGDRLDIKTPYAYSSFPQMLSGLINFKKNDRLKGGYILLIRHHNEVDFNTRTEMFTDSVFANSPKSTVEYIGAFEYQNKFDEQWGGAGLAYRFSDKISLGFTQFISYRTQSYRFANYAKAIPAAINDSIKDVASVTETQEVNFYQFKAISKVGLAIDLGRWKMGLTVTAPSLNLYGRGDVQREVSVENLNKHLPDSLYPSFVGIDRQKHLKPNYKSPFSVSLGIEYHGDKTQICFATERFSSIPIYNVIVPESKPFLRPSNILYGDKSNEFLLVSALNSPVWNFAIALQQRITDKIILNSSFRTDYSFFKGNYDNVKGLVLSPSYWSLYHISGGVTLKRKNSDFIFGLTYGFARLKDQPQIINMTDPKDIYYLFGIPKQNASINVNSYNLVIGYVHYLNHGE